MWRADGWRCGFLSQPSPGSLPMRMLQKLRQVWFAALRAKILTAFGLLEHEAAVSACTLT